MRLFKRGIPIWVYVIIAVLPIVIVVSVFTHGLFTISQYKKMIIDMDNSFVYGMHNDSIRAEYNGSVTRVNDANADLIFQELHFCNYIIPKDEKETGTPIYIEFGDGSRLWVTYQTEESIMYRYINTNGVEKQYLSKYITLFSTFEKLTSIDWGNEPWNSEEGQK